MLFFKNWLLKVKPKINNNYIAKGPQAKKRYGSDKICTLGYHDRGFVIARPADPFAPWLLERIQLLPSKISGSSTNIASAIDLALQVLAHPSLQGYQKRIWILSDGLPNAGQDRHAALLKNARESWVNLNTVALGNFFNSNHGLLRDMATATHNGKFYEVKNLRELRAALGITRNPSRTQRSHRAEATVYAIDCSGSMLGAMEGKRKIDVAVQALEDLIAYKQQTWS